MNEQTETPEPETPTEPDGDDQDVEAPPELPPEDDG